MKEKEFIVNEHITLTLIQNHTYVYVDGDEVMLCKHIALNKKANELSELMELNSIDDLVDGVDYAPIELPNEIISPETIFWVHCSNLQAWAENGYNTRLLHSNLSFPLLQELAEVNEPQAKKIFKEEIVKRYLEGNEKIQQYLATEEFLNVLDANERKLLFKKHAQELEEIEKIIKKRIQIVGDTKLIFPSIELIGGEIVGLHISGHISGKNLTEFPKQIQSFTCLKILILEGFHVDNVPEWIGNLKSLEYLSLGFNKTKKIPDSIGNLIKLKNLDLRDNCLKSIPRSAGKLQSLERLSLSHNKIKTIPKAIFQLKKLWSLSLGMNLIESIPPDVRNLIELKELFLGYNPIKTYPKEISGLYKLKRVYIDILEKEYTGKIKEELRRRKENGF